MIVTAKEDVMTMKQTIMTGLSAASIVLVSGMDKAMRLSVYIALAGGATVIAAAATMLPRAHAESPVERGKYLGRSCRMQRLPYARLLLGRS